MGRSKKIANGEITNEKILGKLPKVKSNLESLDFDEDAVDGISILSFNTYDDLKVSIEINYFKYILLTILAKVEIEFSVVSDRGECQLPDAFYWIKKYCS